MFLLALLLSCCCLHVTFAVEDDQIYCSSRYTHLCMGKGLHVACQFPTAGSGPNCQNYTAIQFTAELRNYITHFINKRRQRIAAGHERVRGGKHIPPTQIMMQVEWDFELARLAQRLADQCYFVHDECRATVKYPYAGQAVGEVRWRHLSNSDELSAQRGIRRVFDAWWGERRRVEPHQLIQPFRLTEKGLVWGHFSQIAVWTLRAVGCGAVRHGEDYPRLLLVCDFSHTNMLGERTLVPGETAPCPERTRRKPHSSFPLLCASVKIPNSRLHEEDTLDESDYDDGEENDNPEILAARKELKRLSYAATQKPQVYEDHDWGNNRLMPSGATFSIDDVTVKPKRTTVASTTEDIDDDEEKEEPTTSITTTTKATPHTTHRKLKIRLKPPQQRVQQRKPERKLKPAGKKILMDENEYRRLSDGRRLSGSFDMRERLPIEQRTENSEDQGNSEPETLILTRTTSPIVLKSNRLRNQKPDPFQNFNKRISTKTTETPVPFVIKNNHMQYNPRHRWKPERERPQRPGAKALLRPSENVSHRDLHELALPPRISFKMDDEVVDQLCADTGFKPSWKKQNVTLNGNT